MGGLPCAKEIIDNMAALQRQATCTSASILLAADGGWQPTPKQVDRLRKLTEPVAQFLAKLEAEARESG